MLASHERSMAAARSHSEPAGQIAAREMEIVRSQGALQRAEELSDDVAAAIEKLIIRELFMRNRELERYVYKHQQNRRTRQGRSKTAVLLYCST